MEGLRDIKLDEADLSVPVLRQDMPTAELLAALRQATDARFPEDGENDDNVMTPSTQSLRRQHLRAITMFGEFLGDRAATNVDEKVIEDFVASLVLKDGVAGGQAKRGERRVRYWHEFGGDIRNLVNSLPAEVLCRPLLTPTRMGGMGRLSFLTPESQAAIRRFLRDGKRVGGSSQPASGSEPLMDSTKRNAVTATLTVMNGLGLDDLRALTEERLGTFLARYEKDGHGDAAKGYFADIGCLFRNLVVWNFVAGIPPHLTGRKPKRVNRDYVPAEGIALLRDLSTLDWDDFCDVRDRMIAVVLCYDFCLRLGEAVRLDLADVRLGRYVEMSLRGSVQKGSHKDDVLICSCLDESMRLVARYLRMRAERRPSTTALLASVDGKRLLQSGCHDAVKGQCDKLGIKTFKGRRPSCHKLRHAFGTLNIEPLGQCLTLYELVERLRHEDVQTTKEIYVDNNPMLQRERHEARMRRNGHRPGPEVQGRHDGSDAVALSLPSSSGDIRLPEAEALGLLEEHDLDIKMAALRKAATSEGWGRHTGNGFLYSESVVRELAADWMRKQEAMERLGMTMPQYFHWTKLNKIATKVIGKASLVRRVDVRNAQREMGVGD